MSELEMKINALVALATTNDEAERASIIEQLKGLAGRASAMKNPNKPSIQEVLLDIGVPDALSGHRYMVRAIELAIESPDEATLITKWLYPTVAKCYDTTASRVERAIRHGIESAWDRGDLEVLAKYFGNTVSISKGRPTNGEFIARIVNYLRE